MDGISQKFLNELRELPWQPKLCKNKTKFRRFQFCKSYGHNVCVYGRFFGVGKFKYANFREQMELP